MFKLIAFFALVAVAFAAPKPDPLTLTAGIPLTYDYPIAYSNFGYGLTPYASAYGSAYYGSYGYNLPLAYRNIYL